MTSQGDKHFYHPSDISVSFGASPSAESEQGTKGSFKSPPGRESAERQEVQDRMLAEQLSREFAYPNGSSSSAMPPLALNDHDSQELYVSVQGEDSDIHRFHSTDADGQQYGGGLFSDWSLARTLQSMEFEIDMETLAERQRYAVEEGIERDFSQKEYSASTWRRQLLTFSTLICVAQIAILITMSEWNGMVSMRENPMYGPPATTMVRFGAKDAGLILYKRQWWRLFSPIMLHAGAIHLVSNVLVQLRVGGYLNLVFGTPTWTWIYLVSGVFGNMCSCIFLPDSVGVGSSGAVMGMLTAWIVWIVFRWKKIPEQCRTQRNCQLFMVLASVAITLGMSFSPYVDWGAHFGGALQGLLWGLILLCHELDNVPLRKILFVCSLAATSGLFVGALYWMNVRMRPSTENWPVYAQNDDWKNRGPPRGIMPS